MFLKVTTGTKPNRVIGLTGNSGSGKSTIRNILKDYAYVIDADSVSRDVYTVGSLCYNDVLNTFGTEILNDDQTINRAKLGKIVFYDKQKLNTLTKITHKYIIKIIIDEVNKIKKIKSSLIVIDAPIIIDTELFNIIDELWVVYADFDILIDRIMKRDNLTKEDAIHRINSQQKFEYIKQYADVLIQNNGESIEQLRQKIFEFI